MEIEGALQGDQVKVKKWRLLSKNLERAEQLTRDLGISPVVAQLLVNRGIHDREEAHRFLHPRLTGLRPPEELPGAQAAGEKILRAVKEGKSICVYGDYDADGITGSAILVRLLRLLGARQSRFYVPTRKEEGYGLNRVALTNLAKAGVQQVITVDCGITSVEEAAHARSLGLELIITDHHEMKDKLPDADLVHPNLPGTNYPFLGLSGAAVALKVAWMIAVLHSGEKKVTAQLREFLLEAICLASLGIVADVVPLLDENRIFVKHGLNTLGESKLAGLKALLKESALGGKKALQAADIGFKLGPRINSAGRIGCARHVVDLLTTDQEEHAWELVVCLGEQNRQRQAMEREILAEALELAKKPPLKDDPILVLAKEGWHPGVIGVVAGKVAEETSKPCLVIGSYAGNVEGEGEGLITGWLGSGRSAGLIPLHEALRECDDLLIRHGGHQAAAGFQIDPANIPVFRQRLVQGFHARNPDGVAPKPLLLDAEVPLAAISISLLNDLDKLEPYGNGNARPVYFASGLKVEGTPTTCGVGNHHLRFRVSQNGIRMGAIGFRMGDRLEELMSAKGECSLAFTPKLNEFNGFKKVDLELVDLQPGKNPVLELG
ncbi:MAG: single-stranded-DNA-specific exonuclease RecJ [Gemmataceae bacterium]|nr:single-stranded-DNA-specific exonuclease RecJ [Gemmataceae bacterium]